MSPAITCNVVLLPAPFRPVSTVTAPGSMTAVRSPGDRPSRPVTLRFSRRICAPRAATVPVRTAAAAGAPMSANALSAAALPSWAAWNSAPIRRSGQKTSGASRSAVNPAVRLISPNTRRRPMPTATSATPSVASNSSTSADRKAIRSVAIAERRWAALSSAIRCSGPRARPSARRVGIPAIRSSNRACRVVMAASAACRSFGGRQPDQHHEERNQRQRDHHEHRRFQVVDRDHATVAGVRIAASSSVGRYPMKYGRKRVQATGDHHCGVVALCCQFTRLAGGHRLEHLAVEIGDRRRWRPVDPGAPEANASAYGQPTASTGLPTEADRCAACGPRGR